MPARSSRAPFLPVRLALGLIGCRSFLPRALAALLLAVCFAVTLGVSGAHAATVTSISESGADTCVVDGGAVKCWGDNSQGQLGDPATVGSSLPHTTPFTVPGITGATRVAVGGMDTCAIDGGAVKCWGSNYYGELGDSATVGSSIAQTTPFTVPGITNPTALAVGYQQVCAIDGGAVKCWGNNANGQLGDSASTGAHPTPFTVPGITNATALAAGNTHTCAIDGGAVKCWGENTYGQVGDPANTNASHPTPFTVSGITNATTLAAGSSHTCALDGGVAKCWGLNYSGQLGESANLGAFAANPTPLTVSLTMSSPTALAAGYGHTCALDGGAVKCWGGVAGSSTGIANATAITAGGQDTCALDGGDMKCFGVNTYGQTGDPATAGSNTSTPYTVDLTAPDAPTLTAPTDASLLNDNTPTFKADAEPGSTVTFILDGTNLGSATADSDGHASFTPTTSLGDGQRSVKATATDATGNVSVASGSVSFTVDATAPAQPAVTAPTDGQLTNDNALSVSVAGEGNTTAHVSLDGSPVGLINLNSLGSGVFDPPGRTLDDGTHTVTVTLTDAAGNESAASEPVSFTVDTTAPAVPTLTAPADGSATSDTTPTFTVDAQPGSTVAFTVDGTNLDTETADSDGHASFTPGTGLDDGQHTAKVTATDAAGNESAASEPVSFTVDTAAPEAPTVTNPVDSTAINDNTPTFEADAEAGSTVTFRLDGTTELGTATADSDGHAAFTPATALTDGDHSVKATATDAAGNVSAPSAARTMFTVDTQAPDTPTFSLPDGTITNDPSTVVAITVEPNATMHILVDGVYRGSVPTGPDGAPRMGLLEGEHTVTIAVLDAAGNASEPATIHYTLDTNVPDKPTLTAPAGSSVVNDNAPTFKADAEPDSTVTFLVDGTTVGTATAGADGHATLTPDDALTDGRHTVKATATDKAGNISDASDGHTFTVDTTAPEQVTFDQAPARASAQPTATFAFTGEPGAQLQCSLDGADWNACTSPLTLTGLTDGPHTLRVRALDTAGNVSAPAAYAWTVDTTPKTTNPPSSPSPPSSPNPPSNTNPKPTTKPKTNKAPRVTVPLAKKTTVTGGRVVTAGCRVNTGALERCQVALYAHGKRIGRATRRLHGRHANVVVRVNLNRRGRKLLGRALGGLRVTAKVLARNRDGQILRARRKGTLYPPTVFSAPVLFDTGRVGLDRVAARLVRGIAREIRHARTVTCEGHTDSRESAGYSHRLALHRARTVCRRLRHLGVHAPMHAVSHGRKRPAAGNDSARGRRANRRVLVRVRY